jgi:hypothetical protein
MAKIRYEIFYYINEEIKVLVYCWNGAPVTLLLSVVKGKFTLIICMDTTEQEPNSHTPLKFGLGPWPENFQSVAQLATEILYISCVMLVAGSRGNIAGLLIVIFESPAGNSCKIVVFSPDYLITFTSTCAINVKHNWSCGRK